VDAPIPVTVITGFLGAGKSTLLERWLEDLPRETTVVIVNEQGDVGIDGALLARRAARLREITGGCICCMAQAALDAALAEFATSTPTPTRILVETSGAASPAGVIRALTRGDARDRLRLDGVITVIDAARASKTLKFGLTIEQLGFGDVVVMSHVDQCEEADLVALEHALTSYAPGAFVARAQRGRLEPSSAGTLLGLLAARSGVLRVLSSEDAGVSRHGIDAVSLVHDGELDELRFGEWVECRLGAIEARILRIKGILAVHGVDERVIVQGVGEAIEVTLGPAWGDAERASRLVILGLGLDEGALRSGFASCAMGDEHRARLHGDRRGA
jgi:G3E family GTPase